MTRAQIVTAAFGLFILLAVVSLSGCWGGGMENDLYKTLSQPTLDSFIEHPEEFIGGLV